MEQPKVQTARITAIRCNDGEQYLEQDYIIEPFSQSSFMVRGRQAGNGFQIIPSRCVDRIFMEAEADEAVNQPATE